MKIQVKATEETIKIYTEKYDKYINKRIATLRGAKWDGSCWTVDRYQGKGTQFQKDQLEMIKNDHLSPNNPSYVQISYN